MHIVTFVTFLSYAQELLCEIFDVRQHVKNLSKVMNKLARHDDMRKTAAPKQIQKNNPDVTGIDVGVYSE